MQKKPLELSDKAHLAPLLASCRLQLSEYSFANLYLFRKAHKYELLEGDDTYIKGITYDQKSFIMPTSLKGFHSLIENTDLYKSVDFIYPIPDEWYGLLDKGAWKIEFTEADSDYIFDTKRLSHYSGRHLSKKRNLVKQFLERYTPTEKVLDDTQITNAISVLDQWKTDEAEDYDACKEAIMEHKALGLDGKIYFVADEPVGFILGEPTLADTYIIHFAKADIRFKGVYQYIYQAFAASCESLHHFINMEQDLGKPSLHQAKHSYHPLYMRHKFRLISLRS